ncbi:MAG: glycerate kinase [Saprospiraceae bacterium]|nr:glycerate kinase [Saprospiraceae bacterium]
MNILLATDSFKDALDAQSVCRAIARGILRAMPEAAIRSFPLADGGEGTAQILTEHSAGRSIECVVNDPLFRPVRATYGLSGDGKTAFIEMAQASGLQLLKPEERNPLHTTTYGTGELIADALRRGVSHIMLGIGGSATNDGGMGMAAALGWQFFDPAGKLLEPVGRNLGKVHRMLGNPEFTVRVEVMCDVNNPLYGPEGAAQVYAPQKGADAVAVAELDAGLAHFSDVLKAFSGTDIAGIPGAGAAGGLGAGALFFLNARMRSGIDAVMEYTGFEAALSGIDLIVTGEGKIDRQTSKGKLISGITRRAAERNLPVIAFCGAVEVADSEIRDMGLLAAFSIQTKPLQLAEAIAQTAAGLEQTATQVFRVMAIYFP